MQINYIRIIKWLWKIYAISFLLLILFVISIAYNLFGLFGEMPGFNELENPRSAIASELYTEDGYLLGKYFSSVNRSKVDFGELNKDILKALIATEDARFEEHAGIDMRGVLSIPIYLLQGKKKGASTITQQLAKNLFKMRGEEKYKSKVGKLNMAVIKLKEWIIAKNLERSYTKAEIITMYLNTVDFIYNSHGIQSAANTYFNKDQSELNLQEIAVLIGMLKSPVGYNPKINPERALTRRNTVLHQMTKYGAHENETYLSESTYDSLKALPIELDFKPENYNRGLATYFRGYVKNELSNIPQLENYDLYSDGLKIYTSLNSHLQRNAEEAVKEHMSFLQKQMRREWGKSKPWDNQYIYRLMKKSQEYREWVSEYGQASDSLKIKIHQPRPTTVFSYDHQGGIDTTLSLFDETEYHAWFLQTGFFSLDPHNGYIKAWVGGLDRKFFEYDHVHEGKRQPGSTFKPILYSAAIQNGWSMCDKVLDAPVTIRFGDQTWTPRRENPTGQEITLKTGLAKSLNNIAAKVMNDVGIEKVRDHAHNMGIVSPLDSVYSLALGTSNVSLYEMVSAYSAFLNKGKRIKPKAVLKIEDKYGRVIYDNTKHKSEEVEVLSEKTAFIMVSMLREGIKNGTSISLRTRYGLDDGYNQLAGKTGTTQNSADGWYMGLSKDLVTGVWVGGEIRDIHLKSRLWGQGARMALPIFAKYLQKSYKNSKTGISRGPFPTYTKADLTMAEIYCEEENLIDLGEGSDDL